jgi:hypothetical protein
MSAYPGVRRFLSEKALAVTPIPPARQGRAKTGAAAGGGSRAKTTFFALRSSRLLFGFQIKIASCDFYLSAAAKAWFRLASCNASHFGATSCRAFQFPMKK